jgi:hypothetical protein
VQDPVRSPETLDEQPRIARIELCGLLQCGQRLIPLAKAGGGKVNRAVVSGDPSAIANSSSARRKSVAAGVRRLR